jgi:hypothetical protein
MKGIAQLILVPPHPFPLTDTKDTDGVSWQAYFHRTMDLSRIGWFQGRFVPLDDTTKSYGLMGVPVYAPENYEVHTCCLNAQTSDFPIFYRITVMDFESHRKVELPFVERISSASNRVPDFHYEQHRPEDGSISGGGGDAVVLVSYLPESDTKDPWMSFETTSLKSGMNAAELIRTQFPSLNRPEIVEEAVACLGEMTLLYADEELHKAFTLNQLERTLPSADFDDDVDLKGR